ncbi:response regulator [Mycoplasmatota bacterium WC44]
MNNVLIVDDTKTNALLLECILGGGYSVDTVFDSEEALSYIEEKHPDIVFLDIVMPNKSGYDILKYIKSKKELSNTSVIVVSGLDHMNAKTKAFELGANYYMEKPINANSLLKVVKKLNKVVH